MDRFDDLMKSFHLCDNLNIGTSNKIIWKKTKKRGCYFQQTDIDCSLTLVGWKDNKAVYLITVTSKHEAPTVKVERHCSDAKNKLLINQPTCISK